MPEQDIEDFWLRYNSKEEKPKESNVSYLSLVYNSKKDQNKDKSDKKEE